MNNEFNEEEWFDDEDNGNSLIDTLLALTVMPKPFGVTWSLDQMRGFLKARGYRVLERFDEETENEYYVAVKKNESRIPDDGKGNIVDVFANEVQNILLKWLLKIGKENDT